MGDDAVGDVLPTSEGVAAEDLADTTREPKGKRGYC